MPSTRHAAPHYLATWIAFIGILAAFCGLTAAVMARTPVPLSIGTGSYETTSNLGFIGIYQTEPDGEAQTMSRTTNYDGLGTDTLICSGRFGTTLPKGEPIQLYAKGLSVVIYQNGEQIFAYGLPSTWAGGTAPASEGWCAFASPGIERNDQIQIVLTKTSPERSSDSFDLFFSSLAAGSTTALTDKQVNWHIGQLVLSLLMLVIALVVACTGVVLAASRNVPLTAPLACALLLICGGLANATDPRVATLFITRMAAVDLGTTIAQLGCLICALGLMTLFVRQRRLRLLSRICLGLSTAVVLGALVALAAGLANWMQVLAWMTMPALVALGVGAVLLLVDALAVRSIGSYANLAVAVLAGAGCACTLLSATATSRPWPLVAAAGTCLLVLGFVELAALTYLAHKKAPTAR